MVARSVEGFERRRAYTKIQLNIKNYNREMQAITAPLAFNILLFVCIFKCHNNWLQRIVTWDLKQAYEKSDGNQHNDDNNFQRIRHEIASSLHQVMRLKKVDE